MKRRAWLAGWFTGLLPAQIQKSANANPPRCPTCRSTEISPLGMHVSMLVQGDTTTLIHDTVFQDARCNNCGSLFALEA